MEAAISGDVVTGARSEPLVTKDRITIGLLCFYLLIGLTLELYWITFHNEMLQHHDIFNKLLSIYWPCDRTYRDPGFDAQTGFTFSLESLNVFSQPLNALLIWAILKRKPYRHALQLCLSTYLAYGTVLYFYVAHLTDYAVFTERTTSSFVLFVVANCPWLLGYGWMAYESIVAIKKRFSL
jgi:hypothetical protein